MSPLTIYFSDHHPTHPEPLRSEKFQTNFHRCDIFVLEVVDQWLLVEPDLELKYNRLSQGEIESIRSSDDVESMLPNRFRLELDANIHRSRKKIVLERSPIPYLNAKAFGGELRVALRKGVDWAMTTCRLQQQQLATSVVQRDCALVYLICEYLGDHVKVFVFRGAAHELCLSRLLDTRRIVFKTERFKPPSLLERAVTPLTVGETLPDLDLLRLIYVSINDQQEDYGKLMSLVEKVEAMTEEQLRTELEIFR